jgi:hypothetical protein
VLRIPSVPLLCLFVLGPSGSDNPVAPDPSHPSDTPGTVTVLDLVVNAELGRVCTTSPTTVPTPLAYIGAGTATAIGTRGGGGAPLAVESNGGGSGAQHTGTFATDPDGTMFPVVVGTKESVANSPSLGGSEGEREPCPAPTAEAERQAPEPVAPLELKALPPRRVRLAWRDLSQGLGPMAALAHEEVAQIFAPLGVTLDWHTARPEEPVREDEISIILLARPRGALPPRVMGAVGRKTARRAWIFLSSVRRLLARQATDRGAAPVDPRELARLTGRVAAHEIVHVIAPQLGHTNGGLMRADWSRALALRARLDLDIPSVRAVGATLDPAAPPLPPSSARSDASTVGEPVPDDAVDLL